MKIRPKIGSDPNIRMVINKSKYTILDTTYDQEHISCAYRQPSNILQNLNISKQPPEGAILYAEGWWSMGWWCPGKKINYCAPPPHSNISKKKSSRSKNWIPKPQYLQETVPGVTAPVAPLRNGFDTNIV